VNGVADVVEDLLAEFEHTVPLSLISSIALSTCHEVAEIGHLEFVETARSLARNRLEKLARERPT
jgi:hypothetical protein